MFKSLGHFFTAIAQRIVHGAEDIKAATIKTANAVAANEGEITKDVTLAGSLAGIVFPQAPQITQTSLVIFGKALHALEDAGTAAAANGINVQLDAATVADLQGLKTVIEQHAAKIGIAKPASVPAAPAK